MDDLFVDPQRILRRYLRRGTLRGISRTVGAAARVCRQRQLLGPRNALGWGALGALLVAVGAGFAWGARWASFLPHPWTPTARLQGESIDTASCDLGFRCVVHARS